MICPTCQRETAAVAEIGEMGAGKLRKRCSHPDCKAALPEEKAAQQACRVASDPVLAEYDVHAVPGIGSKETIARLVRAPANGAPPSFAQIVAQSEARLLQVRGRIAELRSLEMEEKQLVLILTAAGKAPQETKPS